MINDQLATMKGIFQGYTSPNFMSPYMNISQDFKRKPLDAKKPRKWLGVYRYQNTEFWGVGKEGNDLSAKFMQVLNDMTIEDYLKKSAPSMKKMIDDFLKETGQKAVFLNENDEEIGDLADSYRAVKQRFVDFILATADLRNPRFPSK